MAALFFDTDEGAVNAANVAMMLGKRGGGVGFFDAEGRRLGDSSPARSISDYTGAIVPAAAGQTVFLVSFDDDGGHYVGRRSVVAWRLMDDGGAMPIVAGDGPASNEWIFIQLPDGRVQEPFMGESDSLEAAIAEIFRK